MFIFMALSYHCFVNSYYVQGQIPVYVYIIEILLTALMAEISYRFKTPIRKKGFKALHFT